MKRLILIAVAALTVTVVMPPVQAQTKNKAKPSADMVVLAGYKDGVLMKDNKVFLVRDGQGKVMDKGMIMLMGNSTTVMGDGTITKNDGTVVIMKNGTGIDMQGNITMSEAQFKNTAAKHK